MESSCYLFKRSFRFIFKIISSEDICDASEDICDTSEDIRDASGDFKDFIWITSEDFYLINPV